LVAAEWILQEVYIPIIPIKYQESPSRHRGDAISFEKPPSSLSRRRHRRAATIIVEPPPSSWSRHRF
jgi:hypothetical protein